MRESIDMRPLRIFSANIIVGLLIASASAATASAVDFGDVSDGTEIVLSGQDSVNLASEPFHFVATTGESGEGSGVIVINFFTNPLVPSGVGRVDFTNATGGTFSAFSFWRNDGPTTGGEFKCISSACSTSGSINMTTDFDSTTDRDRVRIQWEGFESASIEGTFAAVPLPAAGWMLLVGIGGLVTATRRKKVKAETCSLQ